MDQKIHQMKPLKDLVLLDRFLFSVAMENEEISRIMLETILNEPIALLTPSEVEKELKISPLLRSIRMDVYTMDHERVYNVESQKRNLGNLPTRSRYYQAMLDSSLLPPGTIDFNELKDCVLITIAPFDIFGEGKYVYTFRMRCDENRDLCLDDGAVRMFLNTNGRNDAEVRPELVELLHYIEHTSEETARESSSPQIQKLHEHICRIKTNEEMGMRYMQAWEERILDREEAKKEGWEEGAKHGLELGTQRGLDQGIAAMISTLKELQIPNDVILKQVCEKFDLAEEKAKTYL